MFVTWRRRRLATRGYQSTTCRHADGMLRSPDARRWRLTPVVTFSYRNGAGVPQQDTIWRPRVSINSCCIGDIGTRERFWREVEARVNELRQPPLNESSGAVILDRLEWFLATLAEKVPPVSDDEYAEELEERMRGAGAPANRSPRND